MYMTNKKIIILVGPSGSGKTSIGEVLEENFIPRLVTTTTRAARPGEVEGIDYYFRDLSEMDPNKFVEQTFYNKNRYGLTKDEVHSKLEEHKIVHVSLDRKGSKAVKEKYPNESFVVFVKITEDEMIERMEKRGDSKSQIKERVHFARENDELIVPKEADLVIKNKNVKESAKKIIDYLI